MRTVALGEVARIVSGATPKTGVAEYWGGDVPWVTPADLSKLRGAYIESTPRTLTAAGVRSCATSLLPSGSVLLSSRAPIGHVAINSVPMATNQGFKSLIPGASLQAKFLYHWLRANRARLESLGNGATFKELSKRTTEQILIPLPTVDEQRRIAEILDHADALRIKRRQVLAHLDDLTQSIFRYMFDASATGSLSLSDVAAVTSGITKGRRTTEATRSVPYLAVANVQAGALKLNSVKSIDATESEVARYALDHGDLVLTEGGDPDKLGRGTVWRSEIDLCLHQNHVFRVRPGSQVSPDFLAAWLAAPVARRHFRRSAKQTTGIASINITQLKATPVLIPPLPLQEKFAATVARTRDAAHRVMRLAERDDELFASLQSRAFRGEL